MGKNRAFIATSRRKKNRLKKAAQRTKKFRKNGFSITENTAF
jgi:hypothetical protein